VNNDCPADGANLTTQCRASAGVCDVAEFCSDASDDCPADGANLTTQCRASAGVCDVAEFCSDASDDCPADGFQPLSTTCEADEDECTIDHCDGNGSCVFKEANPECGGVPPCVDPFVSGKAVELCDTSGDGIPDFPCTVTFNTPEQVTHVCIPCGDGNLNPGEDCDDGNNIDGDGCPADCQR
jgi:cysteine-rich repeat protein